MKKFLILLLFAVISLSASAETILFNASGFCAKEYTYNGWTSWSRWQRCDVPITIDTTNDIIVILSERTQYYRIISYGRPYRERGAQVLEYDFIDQDNDKGTLLLVQKDVGASEIYIYFANVAWGYTVHRR